MGITTPDVSSHPSGTDCPSEIPVQDLNPHRELLAFCPHQALGHYWGRSGTGPRALQEWRVCSHSAAFIFISSACSSFQSVNPSDPNELSAWARASGTRLLQFRDAWGWGGIDRGSLCDWMGLGEACSPWPGVKASRKTGRFSNWGNIMPQVDWGLYHPSPSSPS